jgi:hypothetical protein
VYSITADARDGRDIGSDAIGGIGGKSVLSRTTIYAGRRPYGLGDVLAPLLVSMGLIIGMGVNLGWDLGGMRPLDYA